MEWVHEVRSVEKFVRKRGEERWNDAGTMEATRKRNEAGQRLQSQIRQLQILASTLWKFGIYI